MRATSRAASTSGAYSAPLVKMGAARLRMPARLASAAINRLSLPPLIGRHTSPNRSKSRVFRSTISSTNGSIAGRSTGAKNSETSG